MLAARPEVFRLLERIARAEGYRVQASADEHAGKKLYLGYRNAQGRQDTVEFDVNFLFRVPLVPATHEPMWSAGGSPAVRFRVVGAEELMAGKLCALLDRALPRDLYDTRALPRRHSAVLRTPRFKRLFVAVAGTLPFPLYRYGRDRLERATEAMVAEQLHPMLIRGEEPGAKELVEGAWNVIEPLLRLDSAERDYLERLSSGDLMPALLFADEPELASRLAAHPALRWKAQNARKHFAGRPPK